MIFNGWQGQQVGFKYRKQQRRDQRVLIHSQFSQNFHHIPAGTDLWIIVIQLQLFEPGCGF